MIVNILNISRLPTNNLNSTDWWCFVSMRWYFTYRYPLHHSPWCQSIWKHGWTLWITNQMKNKLLYSQYRTEHREQTTTTLIFWDLPELSKDVLALITDWLPHYWCTDAEQINPTVPRHCSAALLRWRMTVVRSTSSWALREHTSVYAALPSSLVTMWFIGPECAVTGG